MARVKASTLLIVGGYDDVVIGLNEKAYAQLTCEKELKIVPGATHLFEEPGTLEQVAQLASAWFKKSCSRGPRRTAPEYVDLSWRLSPLIILIEYCSHRDRLRRDSEFAHHLVAVRDR